MIRTEPQKTRFKEEYVLETKLPTGTTLARLYLVQACYEAIYTSPQKLENRFVILSKSVKLKNIDRRFAERIIPQIVKNWDEHAEQIEQSSHSQNSLIVTAPIAKAALHVALSEAEICCKTDLSVIISEYILVINVIGEKGMISYFNAICKNLLKA